MKNERNASRAGYSVTEVLIALAISTIVISAVLTVFIWSARQTYLSAKIAWSQGEAMNTTSKLTMLIRNAQAIAGIDESEGSWISLRFNDGSILSLVYSNAVPELRDGRMYIVRTNRTQTLVARGLTEIQRSEGFTTPVFSVVRDNAVRIAYRVAEPAASGGRDANDGPYAACTRFAVCLRNAEE
jgi:hypothetical protein